MPSYIPCIGRWRINDIDVPAFRDVSCLYSEIALIPDRQVLNIGGYVNGRASKDDNMTDYNKSELHENAPLLEKAILS